MDPAFSSILHLWFAFISIVPASCYKPQSEAVSLLTATEQLADVYNRLMQLKLFIILLISLYLLASLFSILLLKRLVIQKNRIISLNNAMQTLNKTAMDLQMSHEEACNRKEQLRETLLWKFNVLHKSVLLKSEL